jgi:hypothetical protein
LRSYVNDKCNFIAITCKLQRRGQSVEMKNLT